MPELPGTLRSVMDNGSPGVPDLPAGAFDAQAPVDLFTIHKEALVKQTYLLNDIAPNDHAGAERMVDSERSSCMHSADSGR